MTLSDEDYFVLTQTIRGIQEKIEQYDNPEGRLKLPNGSLGPRYLISTKVVKEVSSMLEGLRGVIEELRK